MLVMGALLSGCPWWSPPEATSEAGMRGVVLQADGKPVVGLKVETVESSVRTDEAGDFGLYYKPPDTHVYFDWENAWYRRAYQAVDEGKRVEILLPPTRSLQVDCGTFDCRLTLDWEYGDGLLARRRGTCTAGESVVLDGSPQGVPAVKCQAKVTEPDLPLSVRMDDDLLELLPPARDIRVRVDGDASPRECVVYVAGVQLQAQDDGRFVGSASGDAAVQVVCNDRAARPEVLAAAASGASSATSADGPPEDDPSGSGTPVVLEDVSGSGGSPVVSAPVPPRSVVEPSAPGKLPPPPAR